MEDTVNTNLNPEHEARIAPYVQQNLAMTVKNIPFDVENSDFERDLREKLLPPYMGEEVIFSWARCRKKRDLHRSWVVLCLKDTVDYYQSWDILEGWVYKGNKIRLEHTSGKPPKPRNPNHDLDFEKRSRTFRQGHRALVALNIPHSATREAFETA